MWKRVCGIFEPDNYTLRRNRVCHISAKKGRPRRVKNSAPVIPEVFLKDRRLDRSQQCSMKPLDSFDDDDDDNNNVYEI